MTQAQIIGHFAEKFSLKRAEAKSFFEELSTLAAKEVKKNGQFVFPGVGKLVLVKRKARMGRNPATGAQIKIPAKTVLKFRIAKAMKDTAVPKK